MTLQEKTRRFTLLELRLSLTRVSTGMKVSIQAIYSLERLLQHYQAEK